MNIDLILLQHLLETMQPRQKFYEVVKAELKRQGRWRNLPRGKAPRQEFRYTKEDNPMMKRPKA